MRIYVASSWRNEIQQSVVQELREAGHEVYDFKHPEWNGAGFKWSEIDPNWKNWTFDQYIEGLHHELAEAGFKSDMDALEWCDAVVLVLPCGRSAHLELGWAVGQGKKTYIYHDPVYPQVEPELMAKMVDRQFEDFERLLDALSAHT